MKIFATCVNGHIALIRDDHPALFLTYDQRVPNGPLSQKDMMEAARVALPAHEFRKNLSPSAGEAINQTIGQLLGSR